MKSVSRRRPSKEGDEPGIEPDMGWVEAGGELILAAGFTEAGFPYGLSVEEFRASNFRDESRAGWARAKYGDPVAEVDTHGLGNPPAARVEDES